MKRWQKVLGIAALSLVVVDSIITSKARDQAAQLSKEWGRPVTIGSVSTKLITGLGLNVSDLRRGGRGRAAARSQARRGEGCAPARGALGRQGRRRFLGGDRRAHRQRH